MAQPTTKSTKDAIRDNVELAKESGRDALDSARSLVRDRMYEAGQSARDVWDNATTKADEARLRAESTIRQRPLTSAALAFGAGLIISKIFSSRR